MIGPSKQRECTDPLVKAIGSLTFQGRLYRVSTTPLFSALHGEGLEAAFEWCRVDGRSEFSAFGSGQSLGYDSLDIYTIDFIVDGDLKSASYWLSAQTASETPIAANGRVPLNANEAMRNTVFFESVPLGWLNTWMPPQSVTWSGEVSGELAIDGTPSLPLIERLHRLRLSQSIR